MINCRAIFLPVLFLFATIPLCAPLYAQRPQISAGNFQSLYAPSNQVRLEGKLKGITGKGNYKWRKLSGPPNLKIISPTQLTTNVSNLVPGEYAFELTATLPSHPVLKDSVSIVVFPTANLKVPVADDYPNLLGSNPGYYGPSWSDRQVYTMMAKAGCRSTRSTIPMFFFKYYGDSSRYSEFKYFYDTLGFRENVYFLYNLSGTDYPDQSDEVFNGERAVVPKGLYLPIWNNDGTVNLNNSFANYCYKSVRVYGKFFRYYEIWNEPDFTGNWGAAGALPGNAGNWWENDPKETDLYNLKAPGQYYIRMLRVAYEVIKRYDPDAIITLGGIGFPSFLHFILRNTDNPEMDKSGRKGSKTAAYPLTGGAYFEGLSFHSYPQFYLKFWDFTIGNMGYRRNSDEAIDHTIRDKQKFEKILHQFGYDGKHHPAKPFICTEINIPRKQIQQDIGGIEIQKNFAWKTIAQAAKNNIKQVYWFVTAETADFATSDDGYKLMGLFKNILSTYPGREQLTEEGMANKSAQLLLHDFIYDSAITRELQMSPSMDGFALRNRSTGEVRFMLWAKTGKDLNESSEVFYSFPRKFADRKLEAYKSDFCVTNKPAFVAEPIGLRLTGEPLIFFQSKEKSTTSTYRQTKKPMPSAGRDTVIHQQFVNLRGEVNASPGEPINYFWDIVSLPAAQGDYPSIKNKNLPNAVIMGLQKGIYGIRFTVSDQLGTFASDTVWIGVDTAISFQSNHSQLNPSLLLNAPVHGFIFENERIPIDFSLLSREKLFLRKPGISF
jgi:hypothetical protein